MLVRPLSGSYSHWPGRCACQIEGGLCSPVGMIIAARGNRTAVSAHSWVGDPIAASTLVTLAARYVPNAELAIRSDPSHRIGEFVDQFLGGSAVGFARVLVLRCNRLHRACVVPDSTKMPHPSVIRERARKDDLGWSAPLRVGRVGGSDVTCGNGRSPRKR